MHESVLEFVGSAVSLMDLDHPDNRVLEIGSYNVNGTARDLFTQVGWYHGIDIEAGPGVDEVLSSHEIRNAHPEWWDLWDVILCLEMLEHDADPFRTMANIAWALRPGGHAIITARGNGFGFHNPPDRWRFLPEGFDALFEHAGLKRVALTDDWQAPGLLAIVTKEAW